MDPMGMDMGIESAVIIESVWYVIDPMGMDIESGIIIDSEWRGVESTSDGVGW
jgi:hypothetical protein